MVILHVTLRLPLLQEMGLSSSPEEALHLKLEISHHQQVVVIRHTPLIYYRRSFMLTHFSLETMMAAKMLACLERSFQIGTASVAIKGNDFYDLLWFMQQRVQPLMEKLAQDGKQPYTVVTAMQALQERIRLIRSRDLAMDLLPLFEQPTFIEQWIESFHENFQEWVRYYLSG